MRFMFQIFIKTLVIQFLTHRPISDLCQKKFFITLEREECFARREQRHYLPNDPVGYFDAWVWPMFLTNKTDMLTINNNQDIGI